MSLKRPTVTNSASKNAAVIFLCDVTTGHTSDDFIVAIRNFDYTNKLVSSALLYAMILKLRTHIDHIFNNLTFNVTHKEERKMHVIY
jgi:hypothetical protein